jgi:hypothetical protein
MGYLMIPILATPSHMDNVHNIERVAPLFFAFGSPVVWTGTGTTCIARFHDAGYIVIDNRHVLWQFQDMDMHLPQRASE